MLPAVITALAFVIAFIVIGLAVVFAAFSGARRGAARVAGPSRGNRKAVAGVVGLVVLLLGVVVPGLVVANGESADSAPGGVQLTAAEQSGREVFRERCATCHTLSASNAVGKVGPNLDALHPPKALTLDAIKNGRARGQGQMPAALVDGEDADDVAAYIAKVAGR
ncbi:MAG: cytochrome [Solirubrobacteraceae bacterium]|jgi:mono/diheme cytochrome c family protein|nr:cytochrome [Solirubrobacteraceae bacterium]